MMVHHDLCNPCICLSCHGRDKAMHLSIEGHPLNDRRAIRLEGTPVIVDSYSGHHSDNPIGDNRGNPTCPELILSTLPPAAHHIKSPVQLTEKQRNIGRIVLEV